jgi:hypothetical protein
MDVQPNQGPDHGDWEGVVMRAVWIVMLALVWVPGLSAQSCGNGLPCGPVPWQLPNLPDLKTPTLVPTSIYASTPGSSSYPSIPGITPPPQSLALPEIGVGETGLDGVVQQMEIYLTATPICILDVSGQCIEQDPQAYAPEPFLIFGYFRGLAGVNFGIFNPLIWFLLAAFTSILGMKFANIILPVVAVLLGLVRKFVNLILNFLPL